MLQWLKIKKIICRFIHLIILLMCLFLQSRAFATTDVDGAYIQDNFSQLYYIHFIDLHIFTKRLIYQGELIHSSFYGL